MQRETIITNLEDKTLDIKSVQKIYEANIGDKEIESMVAMNLSLRTSVYDKELQKSETISQILVGLSTSESMEARWAVAKNPQTPAEILEKLSNDKVNLVRALIATNSNTSSKTLEKFFSDEKIVRDGLSGNINTPVKILNILADNNDKMVRLRVAENPSSTKEILEKLSKDGNQDVSLAGSKFLEKLNEK